jgi:hypothetical protein
LFTLLDNNEGEDREVGTNDTTTDRLSLALTSAARTVARVTLAQQETDTVGQENTLLHGETLFVVTTRDAENVTLELITEGVTRDFLGHTLIEETTAKYSMSVKYTPIYTLIYLNNTYRRRSSSISMSFWQPVAGFAMLS